MSEEKKNSTVLLSEVNGDVSDMAARLASKITVSKETGNIEFDEEYAQTILGDLCTVDELKAIDKATVTGADATHLAAGQAAIDAFKANSDLQEVNGMTAFGGKTVEVSISRTGTVRNVQTGEANEVFLPGATKVTYRKPTSKASFKRVRSALQALAAEELG